MSTAEERQQWCAEDGHQDVPITCGGCGSEVGPEVFGPVRLRLFIVPVVIDDAYNEDRWDQPFLVAAADEAAAIDLATDDAWDWYEEFHGQFLSGREQATTSVDPDEVREVDITDPTIVNIAGQG